MEFNGVLAGYILLSWCACKDVESYHEKPIGDIRIVPEFRGKGVGEALLERAKSIADEKGGDNFTALIWQGNT